MENTDIDTAYFQGVWKRVEYYEPRGQLGPQDEREKIVIWVQSSCGIFIDIRVCPNKEKNENPLNIKSFAGIGNYDSSTEHFTWTRQMDFRPAGPPDVGLINVVSPGLIEEDGVLPGDDFKEIWKQQSLHNGDRYTDFACEVRTAGGDRTGFFLVVGEFFAFTLSRNDSISEQKLENFFQEKLTLSESEKQCLMSYFCFVGKTSDWKVLHSLGNFFLGQVVSAESGDQVSHFLASLSWTIVQGKCPNDLESHVRSQPRHFKGLPIPFFFQTETANRFISMETKSDDVILSSLPKGGTTWMNKILTVILSGKYDDSGQVSKAFSPSINCGHGSQVYPEALDPFPLTDNEKKHESEQDKMRRELFGDYCFDDLLQQPSPRLFSTHLFGSRFLPQNLVTPGGKGRLIIVLRNLKDTLASLHFFRGEPRDGWFGNEHGPGSLNRFIDPNCPNAYGSSIDWIIENDKLYNLLLPTGRVLVVYFEELKANLPQELRKINNFLGLGELSAKKCDAIVEEVGFNSMKKTGKFHTLRRGEVGDWQNHMTPEAWSRLDEVFEERLEQVGIAVPLKKYH